MKKRFLLYVFVILCMVLTMLPQAVLAAGDTPMGNMLTNPGGETVTGLETRLSHNGWKEETSPERGYSYTAFNNGTYESGIALSPHGGTYFMGFYATEGMAYPGGVSCYQDIAVTNQTTYDLSG